MTADLGQQVAQMPPEQAAAFMAALTGGAPSAVDPAAAMMPPGAAPAGAMPPGAMMPPAAPAGIPGMPSTDPGAIAAMMQQDVANLQAAQQNALATAAAGMGGPVPTPGVGPMGAPMPDAMGAPPLGGDPFGGMPPGAAPVMPGMAMGPEHQAAMELSPAVTAAFGGASYGALESENAEPTGDGPGSDFADSWV